MARLFTALEIPEAIAFKLSMFQGGVPGARWIERENYHITLRYFGETDPSQEQQISDALRQLEFAPLNISISGMKAFGTKRPRSIYAAVKLNEELLRMQKQQEYSMQLIGLEPEHRKFTPHITLARLSNVHPRNVEMFCAQNNLHVADEFTATSFALYSANGSAGGGPYVLEERYECITP